MPAPRPFLFPDSQTRVFHVLSRIYDRKYLLDDKAKEFFMKTVRAYEDLLGVEVLTFCVMSKPLPSARPRSTPAGRVRRAARMTFYRTPLLMQQLPRHNGVR